MQTTLDRPDHLVRQAKQRALQQGCSLKDLVSECMRRGLHEASAIGSAAGSEVVTLDPKEWPVILHLLQTQAGGGAGAIGSASSPPPRLPG